MSKVYSRIESIAGNVIIVIWSHSRSSPAVGVYLLEMR